MAVTVPEPSQEPLWAPANPADIVDPPGATKLIGWQANDIPPYGWFNWFWNRCYQWVHYFRDVVNNSYGVQHNVISGAHTAITGTSIVLSGDATADEVIFNVGKNWTKQYLVEQNTILVYQGANDATFVTLDSPHGSDAQLSSRLNVMRFTTLLAEAGAILFEVGADTDLDYIDIGFAGTPGDNAIYSWRLMVFDTTTGVWGTLLGSSRQRFSCNDRHARSDRQRRKNLFSRPFPTTGANHGVHFATGTLCALRIDADATSDTFDIFFYQTQKWVINSDAMVSNLR